MIVGLLQPGRCGGTHDDLVKGLVTSMVIAYTADANVDDRTFRGEMFSQENLFHHDKQPNLSDGWLV